MSQLPQPGDAHRAAVALDNRFRAACGEPVDGVNFAVAGDARLLASGELTGPGAAAFHAAYGDLIDLGETARSMLVPVGSAREDLVEEGREFETVMWPLIFQAVAFGVLMERQRWERAKRDRQREAEAGL